LRQFKRKVIKARNLQKVGKRRSAELKGLLETMQAEDEVQQVQVQGRGAQGAGSWRVWVEKCVDSYPTKMIVALVAVLLMTTLAWESTLIKLLCVLILTVYHNWRAVGIVGSLSVGAVMLYCLIMLIDLVLESYALFFILLAALFLPVRTAIRLIAPGTVPIDLPVEDKNNNSDQAGDSDFDGNSSSSGGSGVSTGCRSPSADDKSTSDGGNETEADASPAPSHQELSGSTSFTTLPELVRLSAPATVSGLHISTSPGSAKSSSSSLSLASGSGSVTRKTAATAPAHTPVLTRIALDRASLTISGTARAKARASADANFESKTEEDDETRSMGNGNSNSNSNGMGSTSRQLTDSDFECVSSSWAPGPVRRRFDSASPSPAPDCGRERGLSALQEREEAEAEEEAFLSAASRHSELRRKRMAVDWSPQVPESPLAPPDSVP